MGNSIINIDYIENFKTKRDRTRSKGVSVKHRAFALEDILDKPGKHRVVEFYREVDRGGL